MCARKRAAASYLREYHGCKYPYFRLPIPTDLRPLYPHYRQGRIERSLKPITSKTQAEVAAEAMAVAYQRQFDVLFADAELCRQVREAGGVKAYLDQRDADGMLLHVNQVLADVLRPEPSAPAPARLAAYDQIAELQAEVGALRDRLAQSAPIAEALTSTAPDTLDVVTIAEAYMKDTGAKRSADTADELRDKIRAFVQWATARGASPTFADPDRARETAKEYIRARALLRKPAVVRKEAQALQRVGRWAEHERKLANPFGGLVDYCPEDTEKTDYTFEPAEVRAILDLARARYDGRPEVWQMAFMLAGTGFRANELLQLRPCDIRQNGDVWSISVNREPDAPGLLPAAWQKRSLKETKYTIRQAAVHRTLIPILRDLLQRNGDKPRLFAALAMPVTDRAVEKVRRLIVPLIREAIPPAQLNGRKFHACHSWRHTLVHLIQTAPGYGPVQAHSVVGKETPEYGRPLNTAECQGVLDTIDPFAGAQHGL